jgi:dolichol-phosphate mannosyltransferase
VPELALIIPTFKEAKNIVPLLEKLEAALGAQDYEVIFVDDDSPDGTADLIRSIGIHDPKVRVIQRIGRRGLSSACMEGMLATNAPYLAVMDADLQHDERILPEMLRVIQQGEIDVVVASRHVEGGGLGNFAAHRRMISDGGKQLSRIVCKCDVSDPMSGFFMVTRPFFHSAVRQTSSIGFKILLDLLASSPNPVRLREVPYVFRDRLHGESKLDSNVIWDFLALIAEKSVGNYVPVRFVFFSLAGLGGALVHLTILWLLGKQSDVSFAMAQTVATFVAMIVNFLLNNLLTFRDRRLKGIRIVYGLITFIVACSIGALGNISLAEFCYEHGMPRMLAGAVGLVLGSVWNYGVTSLYTWRSGVRK